ncbi:MAG: hypothetical protein U9R19_00840 [Bacteroidota bacterium]|nr:hypothetical protein [Bacteroidota bacterium]
MKKIIYTTSLLSIAIFLFGCMDEPVDPASVNEFQFTTMLHITSPQGIILFAPESWINFEAQISIFDYEYSDLQFEWRSNQDGLLHVSSPDDGISAFSTDQLSYNVHTVSISVLYRGSTIASDSVTVNVILPKPVTLFIEKDYNSVSLRWTKYLEDDFEQYKVYRTEELGMFGQDDIIATINNVDDTLFVENLLLVGHIYYYQVEVVNTNMQSNFSNCKSVDPGIFIETSNDIRHMLADPDRNYIYAIDYLNDELLFINTETEDIEKKLTMSDGPIDLDIDASGNTLYVICMNDDRITIIDLQTQTIINTVDLPAASLLSLDNLHYHIACGRHNRLFYVDAGLSPKLRMLNTENWTILYEWETEGVGDLAVSKDGNTLYIWNQFFWGYIPINNDAYIKKIDCSTDELALVQTSLTNIGREPLDLPILLYNNDSKLISKRCKFSTKNINSQNGHFGQNILCVSEVNNIAFSENGIYSLNNNMYLKPMPLTSSIMAVPSNNNVLYVFHASSSRIYIISLN